MKYTQLPVIRHVQILVSSSTKNTCGCDEIRTQEQFHKAEVWACALLVYPFCLNLQDCDQLITVMSVWDSLFIFTNFLDMNCTRDLCIRDCTVTQEHKRSPRLSTILATAMDNYARLVMVAGLRRFAPCFTMPHAPTPPPLTLQLFLNCPVLSSRVPCSLSASSPGGRLSEVNIIVTFLCNI